MVSAVEMAENRSWRANLFLKCIFLGFKKYLKIFAGDDESLTAFFNYDLNCFNPNKRGRNQLPHIKVVRVFL